MAINPLGSSGSTLNQLREINRQQGVNSRRLATGLRVSTAADDAAALAIAEQITGQLRGIGAASGGLQTGINVLQTAEGALGSTSDTLQRMRELAVQANSSVLSDADRGAIQNEMQQLEAQLNQVGNNTQFNGQQLLNGDLTTNPLTVQTGANGETAQVTLPDVRAAALGVAGVNVGSQAGAAAALGSIDTALAQVAEARGDVGAAQNGFESTLGNLATTGVNLAEGISRLRDADVAFEAARRTALQIRQQVGTAALAQSNLNANVVRQLITGA
ncbi:MAG: flagellin FliC [Chloroflexi bacterium]|nr:flagellin FliC [Chloroflexota bacterium]